MDQQLLLATEDEPDIVIASTNFDRSWFSSAGQHRLEFAATGAGAALREQLGFALEGTPALIIDTVLDHGLVAVTSMKREDGSLLPGLGRAVSTLSFEGSDGSVTPLPGVVYTNIGLTGSLDSHFLLDAASVGALRWGDADVRVRTSANQKRVRSNGRIESVGSASEESKMSFDGLEFDSDMTSSRYGFAVGTTTISISAINLSPVPGAAASGPLTLRGDTRLDDGRVNGEVQVSLASSGFAGINDVNWSLQMRFADLDAAAVGRIEEQFSRLRKANVEATPVELFDALDKDLQDLFAAGFELAVEAMDLQIADDTLATDLLIRMKPSTDPTFNWTSALLNLEAEANLRIPDAIYGLALAMYPDFGIAVALGYLKKNGDNYEMAARYRKGLLTINGAPMPVPLPAS